MAIASDDRRNFSVDGVDNRIGAGACLLGHVSDREGRRMTIQVEIQEQKFKNGDLRTITTDTLTKATWIPVVIDTGGRSGLED